MKFFEETDKLPLVHIASNQRDVNVLLCNCHWDCCELLLPLFRSDKYELEKGAAKSRFVAVMDPEKCKACGKCVQMCQFDAAKMKYYPELGETRAYIDAEKCMGCGSCVVNCANEARAMKIVRPPEYVPEEGPPPY
jgi:ferredoxin